MFSTTNFPARPLRQRFAAAALTTIAALALAACGGGDVDDKADDTIATKNKTYTVGGSVSFSATAAGTVTLRITAIEDGSTSDVVIANSFPAPTSYTFDKAFFKKGSYEVSIADQGSDLCLFNGGPPTGEVDKADVTDVNIFCNVFVPPPSYSADFTVTGLPSGASLTAGYSNFFTGESVLETFTIGDDGSTYSFDGIFFESSFLRFDVLAPAGYRCSVSTSTIVIESGVEAAVTCAPVATAN